MMSIRNAELEVLFIVTLDLASELSFVFDSIILFSLKSLDYRSDKKANILSAQKIGKLKDKALWFRLREN